MIHFKNKSMFIMTSYSFVSRETYSNSETGNENLQDSLELLKGDETIPGQSNGQIWLWSSKCSQ